MKVARFTSDTPLDWEAKVHIGIDQSLTGFAVCLFHSGSQAYDIHVFSPRTKGCERLMELRDALAQNLDGLDIVDVAMEGALVYKHDRGTALGEIAGVTKELLFRVLGRPPMTIPPTSLKKYATGKGTAQKSVVMMSVYKKWGVELADDNAADAYVLARMCAGLAETAYEAEAVLKCADPKYRV